VNPDRFQRVHVFNKDELWDWLEQNHQQSESVWLVTFKKIEPDKYLSRDEVLDALIAYGWIDGVRSQVDELRTMQLISPRKTRPWAKSYKLRAHRLMSLGLMKPSGQAEVDLAIQNGGWDEMNEVDELVIPEDLEIALKNLGQALEYFQGFPESIRRNILRWIASAKTDATRGKRIDIVASEANFNRRANSHS
jgi:uncharacterized protein YdeI (YjbR/CyaY-like superfamily)